MNWILLNQEYENDANSISCIQHGKEIQSRLIGQEKYRKYIKIKGKLKWCSFAFDTTFYVESP